jgi:Holliday junction resolvase
MSNKKNGNDFEREFAELLYNMGFWVHLLSQNQDGQPADIIAVKNKRAYLIDCKICSTRKGFDLSRMEDNQDLSMDLWKECGNGEGWFAVKVESQIYMLTHFTVKAFQNQQSAMSPKDVFECGKPLDKWIKQCK